MAIEADYFAVGSGRDFALAAMHAGKNAEDAVRTAAQFNIFTGGRIDVLKINLS